MAEPIRGFWDLECWQKCRELRIWVAREVARALPREEKFRLCDQLLRAARSTTANIAEGFGRHHYIDNSKFCRNARGSCYEVLDHLITAHDEGLIHETLLRHGESLVEQAVCLLNGYIRYLQRAASRESPPDPPTDDG
jgi:four helix bundle protein